MIATKTHPIAHGLLAAGLALAGTLASFAATTTPAQAAGAQRYQAKLATALAAPKSKVINGVTWDCSGDTCSAAPDDSRPINTCIKVAKAFGPLASFSGPKGEFSAEELASCNAGKN